MQRARIISSTLSRLAQVRTFATTSRRHTSWSPGPAPPRLPKEDQELFEKLQRESSGAFSTPTSQSPSLADLRARINQSPDSFSTSQAEAKTAEEGGQVDARVNASGDGGELHPHVRRGAKPEFEGDRNPETGEVGGPKNNPLRWGEGGDWSYNGRVTDF